jgi:hypothetical protein
MLTQERAIKREFIDAVDEKNWGLACRILDANAPVFGTDRNVKLTTEMLERLARFCRIGLGESLDDRRENDPPE